MHVFIDESGKCTLSAATGSWSVVAAYVVAEGQYAKAKAVLNKLKLSSGHSTNEEVKRKHVSPTAYARFLEQLHDVGGIVVAVATDASFNSGAGANKIAQVDAIRRAGMNRDDGERRNSEELAKQVEELHIQSYIELICRLELSWSVARLGSLHYIRTHPATLGSFRWRPDEQGPFHQIQSTYPRLLIGLVLYASMERPFPLVGGIDAHHYRHFRRFLRTNPTRLPSSAPEGAAFLDPTLIYVEDLKFVDSKDCPGVQIADLLASGIRGCLKGTMPDNEHVASALGRLMRTYGDRRAVHPIALGEGGEATITGIGAAALNWMNDAAKPAFEPQMIIRGQ